MTHIDDLLNRISSEIVQMELPIQQRKNISMKVEELRTMLLAAQKDEDAGDSISYKQQLWERKLLDLSLRNNLLNMRLGKNAIFYEHPDIATLEDEMDQGQELIMEQKELKPLYRAVRINLEETGANTLFLTLGSLRWFEKAGGKVYAAPILLMPVEMVAMGKGKFAIRKRDEDVMLNITLIEFLKQNFDIDVNGINPLPQDAHGIDVSLVLHLVNEAMKDQKGWEIVEDSVLGIFSFTKFVMWNDIHRHSKSVMKNPIIQSLIEGRLILDEKAETADARAMDATVRPESIAIPVDADSSQLEAVVESERGRSFILFGPPGTGKSQTITNLIANAVYHGKRVLFVAQKKAALDVVQSRLSKIGLTPFCLELHSNKMDKHHFLQQMQQSIEAVGAQPTDDYQLTSNALYEQRLQLINYVNALHEKRTNGLSLYTCIERCFSINTLPLALPKDFAKGMTMEKADEVCNKILSLASIRSILGMDPKDHPLCGLIPKPQPVKKATSYVSAFNMTDTLEKQLPQLPLLIDSVKQQIERNKAISFISKTTRQYIEGDYRLKKFFALADVSDDLLDDINAFTSAAERWNANISLLPQWQQFTDHIRQFKDDGLEEVVTRYQDGRPVEEIRDAFMAAFYRQMALTIINEDTSLSQFNGLLFEQVIERYNTLCRQFQQLTQKELVARLSSQIPIDTRDPVLSSELTLLRKRIGNKGRGTSIRSIIDQMPNLLPRLCPIMLMSPLSVAQYINIDAPGFDIVVFDEASQMPTCEAIGSIARGKSTVVVGDPKQMPPTSFFMVSNTDEEEADADDLESILDDCIALSMPSRYLGWHYRSKHESLIAYSNLNFYDGRLVTFPSVDDLLSHVTLKHVEGFYDYGKSRTNQAEAKAIVAEALERIRTCPKRSVGIVAFSKQQSDLIEDLLNEELAKYPDLEIQNRESEEPLFIKNLENVQGDERDIILFSVGYGPDREGHVSMNFGPLNKVGGERRLNVAVSRARYEMKIFSTLRPEQIDERRTQAEGVLGLKHFLTYAQQGTAALIKDNNKKRKKSFIVDQIANALQMKGYNVTTSVGTSAFQLDLAVVNPRNPERYLLGIICDGDNYYRQKTARDREIVQPMVLRSLGWKLIHIWAIEWFMHPDIVIKDILAHL